jgi:hypothetical protein
MQLIISDPFSRAAASRKRISRIHFGAQFLLATKLEHDTRGIANVILVIAKGLR